MSAEPTFDQSMILESHEKRLQHAEGEVSEMRADLANVEGKLDTVVGGIGEIKDDLRRYRESAETNLRAHIADDQEVKTVVEGVAARMENLENNRKEKRKRADLLIKYAWIAGLGFGGFFARHLAGMVFHWGQ